MKNIKILICIILFFIVSIITIYSSTFILSTNYKYIYIKQILWYLVGFLILFILYKKKKEFFYKYDKLLYIIGNILLILVLFFGTKTNGSKAWFYLPQIGSIQPSEFMKIFLIIILTTTLDNYDNKRTFKSELLLIVKCIILVLIPSILTFLEPDTGNVIIYFVILIIMLFIYGIRYRWFIISFILICLFGGIFLYLYFKQKNMFINIFGTNFFYRMDRILYWKNKDGMQLKNALAAIGSAPMFGYGIKNTPIYFPEAQTDFIISVFISNFGYIISILFLLLCLFFDLSLIFGAIKQKTKNKYLFSGIISIIIFQQIQNIGMNLGLLPITGVTLPFISYGGSSLISYMILIGLLLNVNKKART